MCGRCDGALAPRARHPPARAKRPRGGLLARTCTVYALAHRRALTRVARGPSSVTIRPARGIPRNARRTRHRPRRAATYARVHTTESCAPRRAAPADVVARAHCSPMRRCIEKGESVRLGKGSWQWEGRSRIGKRNGRRKCKETWM